MLFMNLTVDSYGKQDKRKVAQIFHALGYLPKHVDLHCHCFFAYKEIKRGERRKEGWMDGWMAE